MSGSGGAGPKAIARTARKSSPERSGPKKGSSTRKAGSRSEPIAFGVNQGSQGLRKLAEICRTHQGRRDRSRAVVI